MAKQEGKVVAKTNVKRQKGKMYYCGTENGNVTVVEIPQPERKKKVKAEKEEAEESSEEE